MRTARPVRVLSQRPEVEEPDERRSENLRDRRKGRSDLETL